MDEIKRIGWLECPVSEFFQNLQILVSVIQYKIIGCVIHEPHKLQRFIDNSLPQAPGKHSSKQTGYFNIRQVLIPMRYRYGIALYKSGLFKAINLSVKQ